MINNLTVSANDVPDSIDWRANMSRLPRKSDNNTLHTEPRAARLLETMIFAAAR
jgi:hypothetical protein